MKRVSISQPVVEKDDLEVNCCGTKLYSPRAEPFSLKTQTQLSGITLGHTPSALKSMDPFRQEGKNPSDVIKTSGWKQFDRALASPAGKSGSPSPLVQVDQQIQSSPLSRLIAKRNKKRSDSQFSEQQQQQPSYKASLSTTPRDRTKSFQPEVTSLLLEVEEHRSNYQSLMTQYASLREEKQRNLLLFRQLLGRIRSKEKQMVQVEATRRQQLDQLRRSLYQKG